MQAARLDIADTQVRVARQSALDTDRRLNVIRFGEIRYFAPDRLRLRECSQRVAVRNRGKQIEQSRIVNDELLLSMSIESVCLQGSRGANQIVENTGATANHGFRLTLRGKPWRPGERYSGREQKRAA